MKKIRSTLLLTMLLAAAPICSAELFEDKKVSKIEVILENCDSGTPFDPKPVLTRLKTKEGDGFSEATFDSDLKALAQDYDHVEPEIVVDQGKIIIKIKVSPKPFIHEIQIDGAERYSKSRLLQELDVKPGTVFNRQEFNKAFNKLKEFYFKNGYFESQIDYTLVPTPECNQVDIKIHVAEGRPGLIRKVVLKGFTKSEKAALTEQMYLKSYNFLTSWLTGNGLYRDEALEQDRTTIINFLQNKGYADARVDIDLQDDPESGKLIVEITAHRGSQYRIGSMSIQGNTLLSTDDLMKRALIHPGDVYSPEKIRETSQAIKDLYGQKGYIDASVQYETQLKEDQPIFDLDFQIEEGESYKVGLIHIFGNSSTKSNVILRESNLVPGETFDSRKLKATQQKLEAVGYFKSVNVYAVRTPDDEALGSNYRDVYIEVEETSTGNISLFMGLSSMDDVFGGLDLTERNFQIGNVLKALKGDVSTLRGGGEYFHARGTAGKKQSNFLLSWLNPYVNDSLWRLGVELSQTYSKLQKHVKVITYGGSVTASYPLSTYWTAGMRERLRHSFDSVSIEAAGTSQAAIQSVENVKKELDQQGLISAFSGNINYDSVDNPYKPHRGWRSYFEAEIAGIGGNYVFGKLSYLNSIYFPVWTKGTLKLKGDFGYLLPFGKTKNNGLPYSERFFLGGDRSMRGYKPWQFGQMVQVLDDSGQYVNTDTPLGGLSSAYMSLEFNQEIFRMLDAFLFVDVGNLNMSKFSFLDTRATAGGGVRLDIGNRTPIMLGWAWVFNENDRKHKAQPFFFSMGGQF